MLQCEAGRKWITLVRLTVVWGTGQSDGGLFCLLWCVLMQIDLSQKLLVWNLVGLSLLISNKLRYCWLILENCMWKGKDVPSYLGKKEIIPVLTTKQIDIIMSMTQPSLHFTPPPPLSDSQGGHWWLPPSFDCHADIKCLALSEHISKSRPKSH